MEQRIINPWKWQDQFAFAQAYEVSGGERVLYCAGQASVDAEGRPAHVGDMRAQVNQALDNLETVLRQAGFGLSNVARLNYYTTNVDQLFANWDRRGCKPVGSSWMSPEWYLTRRVPPGISGTTHRD